MQIWTEFSTKQIFGNTRPGRGSSDRIVVCGARNAYTAAQVAVRDISPVRITGIELRPADGGNSIRGIKARLFRENYDTYNDRTSYPDRLSEIKGGKIDLKIPAHCTQGFWIDFFVSRAARTGMYGFTLRILTECGAADVSIFINVHKATVRQANKSTFGHEYFFNLNLLPEKAGVRTYSEEWWKLLEHYADVMRELRNNTICVQMNSLLTHSGSCRSDGGYKFVWDDFDRFVQLFIDRGAARDFTVSGFIQSVEGKVVYAIGEGGRGEQFDTFSPEAEAFITAVYSALEAHLKKKGWDKIFRSHIEDEPHTTEGWLWADALIAKAAPSIVTGEPLDMIESAEVITKTARWAVPRINVHDEDPDVFRDMVKRGGELWLYSCCFPEEAWWLNKFVDLPFIRSRLMEWACVGVGAKGFLHWGFNYWGNGDSLYGFNADARFKGDGAIVYANLRRKKLDLGLRFMNTRDGLQDADLFMQILELGDEYLVNAAKKLLAETTGGCFTYFSDDSVLFEKNYERLLRMADEL
ncbi:MAG: DUF4091 domain-containing protein [Clostridia bacterium]|nr:DUF4091 domain-containing protein [Clostridia bacterium]